MSKMKQVEKHASWPSIICTFMSLSLTQAVPQFTKKKVKFVQYYFRIAQSYCAHDISFCDRIGGKWTTCKRKISANNSSLLNAWIGLVAHGLTRLNDAWMLWFGRVQHESLEMRYRNIRKCLTFSDHGSSKLFLDYWNWWV